MGQLTHLRTALITGGARGIGRAIGLALAEQEWNVAFCYRRSESTAAETCGQLLARGARVLSVQADVAKSEEAEALVRRTAQEFGRIDALIHCAGPYHRVDLMHETPEGWREMFDHNLHSLFYCARSVAPLMAEQKWGRIIAFSLANADRLAAQPHVTAHSIAKTGVLILIRTLAQTLASQGITCNAISPGFIDSGSASPSEIGEMAARIPAGRLGTATDAVNVALFLMSEQASYVNGASIPLSGGWGV